MSAIPRRRVTMGAPNGCGGAEKSQQCHKYILQYRTYASERPQFRIWGRQTASCSGRHLTSLRPCTAHVATKLMKVNLPAHEGCTTFSMDKKKEFISFTVNPPAEFHPPVVKNVVLTLFQGRFS